MVPSSPDAIASAVADCWTASGAPSVDEAKLQQLGWKAGSMSSPDGKAVETTMRFYGKSGSNVMLMLMNTAKSASGCTIVSRVAKPDDIGKTVGAVQKALVGLDPQVKTARSGGSIVFLALPRIAMMDATGTKEKPGARITVGYQNPEKK
jgi:hypothetical protein